MDVPEDTKVCPPGPGKCPVCATAHDPQDPHDRNSLYYQMRFRRRHRRFPTWADAMAHCRADKQAAWKAKLMGEGVPPEELGNEGKPRVDKV